MHFTKNEDYAMADDYINWRDSVKDKINNPQQEAGGVVGTTTIGRRGIQFPKGYLKTKESPSVTPQCPRPVTYEVVTSIPNAGTDKSIKLGYGFAIRNIFTIPFHFWAATDNNICYVKVTTAKGTFFVQLTKHKGKHLLYSTDMGHSFIPLAGIPNATKIQNSRFVWPEKPTLSNGQIYTMSNNLNSTVLSDVKIVNDGKTRVGHHATTTTKGDCGSPVVMSFSNSASNLPQSHYLVGTHEWGNYSKGRNGFIAFTGVKSFLAKWGF